MRVNKTKLFKPIDAGYDLTVIEIKLLQWFLSFGRACMAMLFIFSCIRVVNDGSLIKVLWYLCLGTSVVFAAPLICFILLDTVLAITGKKHWSTIEVLGAAFLGWDRFDAQSGRTPTKLNMPSDYFRCDCDLYIEYVKNRLDFFNKEAVPHSRLSFYLCLLDACDRLGIVSPKCVNSPLQRSLFLKSLGDEYSFSERSLKKRFDETMNTKENDYHYDLYLNKLEDELKDLQSKD